MSEADERTIGVDPMEAWAATAPSSSPIYVPSETAEFFIAAAAEGPPGELRLLILEGPRGEGKTTAGIYACIEIAQTLIREGRPDVLPLRVACIRDTWVNLARTTLVSFEENQRKGLPLVWRDGRRECLLLSPEGDGRPFVHVYFFGLDRPDDADKLQGFVCGVLWPEEVAPAAGFSTGIPAEVLALGGTSLRQAGVRRPRILVTMNSPDEDHWIGRVEEELEQRGLRSIRVHRLTIAPGEKALADGTPVLTPSGWVKIEDLAVGDAVIAGDGTMTRVTGSFPQGSRPLWRLWFSDRTSLVATDDHLWEVVVGVNRRGGSGRRVATTAEVRIHHDARGHIVHEQWALPLLGGPAALSAHPVPLDPYILGVLLGDGTLSTRRVHLTSADTEVIDRVRTALPPDHQVRSRGRYGYAITGPGRQRGRGSHNVALRAVRVLGLAGHKAWEKFIPDVYLWNSPDVRLALLQGLMDTDGSATTTNSARYDTTAERLAEGVEFLVRSLGGLATRRRRRSGHYRTRGVMKQGRIYYTVTVRLPAGMPPFLLPRKACRVVERSPKNVRRRRITGYESAGEGRATCIRVEHPSGLFVTDHFVVTHNSAHFRAMALEAGADEDVRAAWTESAEEFDAYRERNRALLESVGRHDLVARLVEGRRGGVQIGEPVVPNFSAEQHVCKDPLPLFRALPILRGWDQEPNPAVCIFQVLPEQRGLNVLGSHTLENSTMEQLVRDWLLPWQARVGILPRSAPTTTWGRGPQGGLSFEDIGDPVFLNQQLTAGQVLQRLLGTTLTPGPVGWEERRAAALACFERGARGGRRFVLIEQAENQVLIQGLGGRFRYPREQSTGRIVMTAEAAKRVSGKWSNPCDALFYGLAVKFPAAEWLRRGMARPAPAARSTAKSYLGA